MIAPPRARARTRARCIQTSARVADPIKSSTPDAIRALHRAGVRIVILTLVKGDLRGVARAMTLSRRTMRNIKENLFFAFVYNALGVPIAAGVLYPCHR